MDKNAFVYKKMPASIHGRNLFISHGQNRAADRPRIRYGAGCIEITIDHLLDPWPPEAVLPRELFIILWSRFP